MRDTIHPHTNKRYLSKSEIVQQLAEERQARHNAEKTVHQLLFIISLIYKTHTVALVKIFRKI